MIVTIPKILKGNYKVKLGYTCVNKNIGCILIKERYNMINKGDIVWNYDSFGNLQSRKVREVRVEVVEGLKKVYLVFDNGVILSENKVFSSKEECIRNSNKDNVDGLSSTSEEEEQTFHKKITDLLGL